MNMKNDFRTLQEAYTSSIVEAGNFKKFPKPIKLAGSNLSFYGIGRDASGNKIIKVGAGGKGFTIQTNQNVPTAHRVQMGDAPSEKELKGISSEVNKYVQAFGSKKQKALMGESMIFHTPEDVYNYVCSRWGVCCKEDLSSADQDRFDIEYNAIMDSHPIISEAKEDDYKKVFNSILSQYGASSPAELSEKDKKEFFDKVDAAWKADNETDVDEELEKPEEEDQTDVDTEIVDEEASCDEEEEVDEAKEDETIDDIEKEIDDEYAESTVTVGEKKYGLSQGMIKAFGKGADIVVKKVCNKCGFHMPAFSGRYPTACPLCGDNFDADDLVAESFGAYKDGKCVGILTPIDEGKFKEADIDIQAIIDDFVAKRKGGQIATKADLLKKIKALSMGKDVPSGIEPNFVKKNISAIAKGVADAFRKEGIKF